MKRDSSGTSAKSALSRTFEIDRTVVHGRSRHFLGLLYAHEARRNRARDEMLSSAFARPFKLGQSHKLNVLQGALVSSAARDVYLLAVDKQLHLIHAEESRIEKLRDALVEAPDKESRIEVAKELDAAFARLEELAAALKEVSEI